MELLGCTTEELKKHLESHFEPWMSWNNYGRFDPLKLTWNIDHTFPLAYFDLTDDKNLAKVCHYTNLRPMLCTANSSKGDKV